MNIDVKEYRESDYNHVVEFMEKLQDHIIEVDTLKRNIRTPEYGKEYTDDFLKRVNEENGKIYILRLDDIPVGVIGGIIETDEPIRLHDNITSKTGRIIELYLNPDYRGKGLGKLLMQKIEDYFREHACTIVVIEVFIDNKDAHEFYKSCGYADRSVDVIKTL